MSDRFSPAVEARSDPGLDDEAVYRDFAENIPTLAWIANPDGYITWYNRGWYDYSGTTPEQMEGWGWQSVHDPEILPSVMKKWQAAIATAADFEMIFPLRGADGEFRPFLTRIKSFKDDRGKVLRWFGTNTDISLQKDAEGALERSEVQLRQAVAAGGGIGTWHWDIKADRVTADDTFTDICGVDRDLARIGVPIEEFFIGIDKADRARVETAIAGALKDCGSFSEEYRLVVGGVTRWVAATGQVLCDAYGHPDKCPGMGFDITERKQGEIRRAALLELSDRLRDLDDSDEIGFVGSEVLAGALSVTRAGYGVIDKDNESFHIARDWSRPDVASIAGTRLFRDYGSYIEDLKAGRTVAIDDVRTDPRTARFADALEGLEARAFIDIPLIEQGGFVALIFVSHDQPRVWRDDDLLLMREIAERVRAATERVNAEQARRASEDQFRAFAEAVPNHIWAARPDGDLYWFNQQVIAYAGETQTDLSGVSSWAQIVHPDDRDMAGERWAQSLTTGEVYEVEFRIRRYDGEYRWFLVRAEPVRDAEGALTGWVGTNTDVDERRRQGEQLEQLAATLESQVAERTSELMSAEEALRQSQKMEAVGQLTGGLAHDFNNLLTAISGGLEMIAMRIAQGRTDDIERYSNAAQTAAKRAAALTHRLLAFSRRQTLDPKLTDVNRLVGGMEELVRRTVGPAVEFEVVGAAGLWPVLVDQNQLENALLNLVINARDAMPDGGRLTIETGNRWLDPRAARERDLEPGQYVSLCVSDSGSGMTPEVIAKAFDPFFTTKPLGVGTGLGLSMIYGFARQSGGQVRIYSDDGQGTMVCVYLPRSHGTVESGAGESDAPALPRAAAGDTVLVVDDEAGIRMLITDILEELGYQSLEAEDGQEGLAILQSDARIDLLITDVGLPGGMNGRQMADAARLARSDLKVLFITGYAENAVIGNGQLDPGMHVMTKPFELDSLGRRIKELINQ